MERGLPARRTRLAIFDFDGTLADTLEDVVWCMGDTFAKFGLPAPDRSSVSRTVGMTLEQSAERLADGSLETADILRFVDAYRRSYAAAAGRHTLLYPGVKSFLERARDAGVTSVVVSNKGVDAIRSALTRLEIAPLVAEIFAGDTTRHRKPDPLLYEAEIRVRFSGVDPSDVLVVGDTAIDLRWAAGCGLPFCWAAYGYGSHDECAALAGARYIHRIDDLWPYLR